MTTQVPTTNDQIPLRPLFAMFFGLIALGTLYLRYMALDTGLKMNLDRSIFWTINALTLTGFGLSPNGLSDFSPAGILGVYVLMLAGVLFAMIVGGLLVCRYAALPHTPWKLATGAVLLVLSGTLLGAANLLAGDRFFYAAMFEATSALANAGLNLEAARRIDDWRLHLIVLPLAAIGAIGLPVVIDLFDRLALGRPVSEYSQRVLRIFAIAWLASFALLLLGNAHLPLRQNILMSWVGAINTRSLGMEIHLEASLPRLSWWCMAILMVVGAPPGGSGGGLRLLPLCTILRHNQWKNQGGFAPAAIARATAWLTLFASLFITMYLLLMSAEPQLTSDRLVVMAAGAIGNVGLSQDTLSLSTSGLMIISAGMLAGFLLPLRFMYLIVANHS